MFTQPQLNGIIASKQLKLSFDHALSHFSLVIILLVLTGFNAYDDFESYFNGNGLNITASLILLQAAALFYLILKRRLRFWEVETDYTNDEFQEALRRTATALRWNMGYNNKKYTTAYRPWSWTNSAGELIIIISVPSGLLINSIGNADLRSSITLGRNKKNIDAFLANLKAVKAGIAASPERITETSGWGFKEY